MDTIGRRVRATRERRLWTQEDLAHEAGVPVITISRIENDRYQARPRPGTLKKLAAALGVDAVWLTFGGDGETTEGKAAA